MSSKKPFRILSIRAASMPQVRDMVEEAISRFCDKDIQWTFIIQPNIENDMKDLLANQNVKFLHYTLRAYSYRGLKSQISSQISDESYDLVLVPFNNHKGKGYISILNFLSKIPNSTIEAYKNLGLAYGFVPVVASSLTREHLKDFASQIAGTVVVTIAVPIFAGIKWAQDNLFSSKKG
ncbi:MAG: hypothetical protein JKX97_03325 [Candidatus Lindowbacteria bacterium]|nr:hypothetical protein [Candidatus Lindowbacteria bacterium]